MPNTLTSRALACGALLAVLIPHCSASSLYYNDTRYGVVHASATQDIYSAEYDAMLEHGESEEGEVFDNPMATNRKCRLTASSTGSWKNRRARRRQIHIIQNQRQRR